MHAILQTYCESASKTDASILINSLQQTNTMSGVFFAGDHKKYLHENLEEEAVDH